MVEILSYKNHKDADIKEYVDISIVSQALIPVELTAVRVYSEESVDEYGLINFRLKKIPHPFYCIVIVTRPTTLTIDLDSSYWLMPSIGALSLAQPSLLKIVHNPTVNLSRQASIKKHIFFRLPANILSLVHSACVVHSDLRIGNVILALWSSQDGIFVKQSVLVIDRDIEALLVDWTRAMHRV